MSDKSKLVKRLEKFLPTALADQIAEEVVDSLWLAEHDEEVRAGVVAEEPEWEYDVLITDPGAPAKVHRRRKAGPWVPVKQEGAE